MFRGTVVAWVVVIHIGGGIGLYFGAKESADYQRLNRRVTALEQKVDATRVEPTEAPAREGRSP
jgi:hypothetical protein